ncbi:hypothetical protein GCM10022243_60400 [Saccharothrix violaceirubra]|uniref:Uncharacterized protein n=1 Tax=Saccharothrix violaceirubra TaxID=413306 RepID=A0A7W7T7I8_9PSEU|nr:hypothetical protein [Saccharothrix violaceirubra]MBB4968017.1 hypothetical protein [Saccharothrix violaceirubra]
MAVGGKGVDAERLDREARELFRQLTPAPVTGHDKDGRPLSIPPGERLAEIGRRARFIAVSDALARAVVVILGREGVPAAVGHVQVDPAASGDEQVLGLLLDVGGVASVVPLRPGDPLLRGYAAVDGVIDLVGRELAFSVDLVAEDDGWVGAEAVAAGLLRARTG